MLGWYLFLAFNFWCYLTAHNERWANLKQLTPEQRNQARTVMSDNQAALWFLFLGWILIFIYYFYRIRQSLLR